MKGPGLGMRGKAHQEWQGQAGTFREMLAGQGSSTAVSGSGAGGSVSPNCYWSGVGVSAAQPQGYEKG